MNILTVKNKETGFTYNLDSVQAEKLVKTDSETFEIITEGYIPPAPKTPETTTYQKVVVEEPKKGRKKNNDNFIKSIQ